MACAYVSLKKYDEALITLKKSMNLYPDYVSNYYNIAEVYIKKLNFKNALEALKIYWQKASEPNISDEDRKDWLDILNKHKKSKYVSEIINLISVK